MPQLHSIAVPTRLPLIVTPENRDNTTNKDARLINCFLEKDKSGVLNLYRRPGMLAWGVPSGQSGSGQGSYYWNGSVYSIFLVPIGTNLTASVTTSTTGGTLAAGPYYYVVAGLDSTGKVIVSNEVTVTTTGTTSSNTITYSFPVGATNCYVYRGTVNGQEDVAFVVTNTSTSFVDTGAAGSALSPPITDGTHTGALYKNLTSTGVVGLDPAGGVYSFSSIMGATPKLVFQNGNRGYAYDDSHGISATLHALSPSYPQYTVKGLSYLDGTMYVCQHFFGASVTPAVIWGSGINDVTTANVWDPLNFITAQIEPDSGVYLAKQLVYVVCLKEWTTEFFFDAGNATGSPLQSSPNLKLPYGCATADSVQSIQEVLFWISTNRSASNQVVMLERAQLRVVSTQPIDRLLNQADLSVVYSWQIKLNGHSFYVVTIKNANLTLAYDLDQDIWCQWTDANGNYIPIVSSCRDSSGNHVLQHETNGTLYYGSSNYTTDNSALIPVTIITPEFDAQSRRKKQLSRMFFLGDQVPGSSMTLSVSDDNYQTWSMPRTIDLGQKLPQLSNCGTFRRRAFKLQLNNSAAWRLNAVELQYDLGTL